MLLIIKLPDSDEKLFRTVTRNNIIKVAKSVHSHFPESNYAYLVGMIFNGIAKDLKELTLP